MKEAPSFQMYAEDFLTGVMYLTNEEVGVYIKMICKQWTDKKIPKKRLGLFVGIDWDDMSEELKSKFEDNGEYVINPRIEQERTKKENFIKKQRDNGKLGGRPSKKTKPKSNPNQTQKKPLEEGKQKKEEGKGKKENESEIELWPNFDDFWDLYDKKVGKKEKIKSKFERLPQKTKEAIMAYIPDYKISQPDKQYRKHPETFLNNESWNDEIITKHGDRNKTNGKSDTELRGSISAKVDSMFPHQ